MASLIKSFALATLTISSVLGFSLPRNTFEPSSLTFDDSQPSADNLRYSSLSSPIVIRDDDDVTRDDDELSTQEKTLALQATVYDNLAPLVQLAATTLTDSRPIDGLTKMKSGYSKVITSTVLLNKHTDGVSSSSKAASDAAGSARGDVSAATAGEGLMTSVGTQGKSIEESAASSEGGGGAVNSFLVVVDEDEEDKDVEIIVPGRGDLVQDSPTMSAQESLAIFLRKHLKNASQSAAATQSDASASQPMAAKLTISDDASASSAAAKENPGGQALMKEIERRVADFVEKFMSGDLQAKMHEVRVEQRANGLQEYVSS